ncbi:hypothetical protein BH18THE1_BH18THE1_06020 [soil metagenome]
MLLPNRRRVENIEDVKEQIGKIISNNARKIESNLKVTVTEIQSLVSEISEFNDNWTKSPTIYRIAWISNSQEGIVKNITFKENIVLPDVSHDLELIIKMLNHMRESKNLKATKMPLFIHPDEISITHKEGKFPYQRITIISQIAIVFQKGRIKYVGVVIDRNYVLLQNKLIELFT